MGRRIEHNKRPKRNTSNRVWDGATTVLGQPPDRMIILCGGGRETTRWLIEVNENVEIDLMGNQKQVVAQLEEMQ